MIHRPSVGPGPQLGDSHVNEPIVLDGFTLKCIFLGYLLPFIQHRVLQFRRHQRHERALRHHPYGTGQRPDTRHLGGQHRAQLADLRSPTGPLFTL